MNSAMEFHDSGFEKIEAIGSDLELVLDAYVFKSEGVPGVDKSTGWKQTAILRFADGSYEGKLPEEGEWISHGDLVLGGTPFSELLPMPFENNAGTELKLEFTDGNRVSILGSSFKAELVGEATFIEDIPWTKTK